MSSFPTRELAIHEDCISRTDASKKKTASSLSLLPFAVAIGAVVFVFVAAIVQASTTFSATASEAIEAAPASSSTFLYLCRLRLSKAVFGSTPRLFARGHRTRNIIGFMLLSGVDFTSAGARTNTQWTLTLFACRRLDTGFVAEHVGRAHPEPWTNAWQCDEGGCMTVVAVFRRTVSGLRYEEFGPLPAPYGRIVKVSRY